MCGAGIGTDLTIGFLGSDSGGAGAEAGCQAEDFTYSGDFRGGTANERKVADEIDKLNPKHIERDLGQPRYKPSGDEATNFDLVGKKFVIEVFEGTSSGKQKQIRTIKEIASAEGRTVAVYAPEIGKFTRRNMEQEGVTILEDPQQAADWIDEVDGP
jgi:hypothetical protein